MKSMTVHLQSEKLVPCASNNKSVSAAIKIINEPESAKSFEKNSLLQSILKAQDGCRSSAEEIIRKFKNYVFQMEKRFFIPGGDREDLFQEGFIGLYHAISTYNPESSLSFRDYVSLSIRNSVIRAVRTATQKKQMVLTRSKSIYDKSFLRLQAKKANPEESAIRTLTAEQICEIVNSKLSSVESQILRLKVIGYSSMEIGDFLNLDKKAVDNALYRARQKIKKYMKREKSQEGQRKRKRSLKIS